LEGLDATEKCFSSLERTRRLDAEFFSKRHLRVDSLFTRVKRDSIASICKVSDGNHFSISDEFVDEGVPYYRGKDAVGHTFIEDSAPNFITQRAFDVPYMHRSHLRQGDVLLSIIGTIGESSLVSSSNPATCSCKLAILRPHDVLPEYLAIVLRSEMGRSQTDRFTRGAVQMGLLLEDMDQLWIPRFSVKFEKAIAAIVATAKDQFAKANYNTAKAEATLTDALGLGNWQPPEPLTYTRRASDTFTEGRLDAEFHRPKVEALKQVLGKNFEIKPLSEFGVVENGQTVPYDEMGEVPIIRSGDLSNIDDDNRFLKANRLTPIYALQPGDVLVSSIGFGSIGKVQVFDKTGIYGTVSEVTVIRQKELNPYFVTIFLRSPFGQMQIDRYITGATGQLHLYKRDVQKIFLPIIPSSVQKKFETLIKAATAERAQARALLDAAKRAVEIAVEQSEAAALAFLQCIS
jgi:hypothetical protein